MEITMTKNRMLSRILFFLSIALLSGIAFRVNAASLTYSSNTNISLTPPSVTLVIQAGSVADNLVVNVSNVAITMSASTGGTFTLTSPQALSSLTVGSGGTLGQTCSLGIQTNTITQTSGSETYTLTPTGFACTVSPAPVPVVIGGYGGGMPIKVLSLPAIPQGGFKVLINNAATSTNTKTVTLTFNADSDVKNMAISEDVNFANTGILPYASPVQYILSNGSGNKTIYVKFYTQYGQSSPPVSASIFFNPSSALNANSQTPSIVLFTHTLKLGNINPDVKRLQQFLNTHGFPVTETGLGSLGNEINRFGLLTKLAVIKFQEKYATEILMPLGLNKGTGIVAGFTLKQINSLLSQ